MCKLCASKTFIKTIFRRFNTNRNNGPFDTKTSSCLVWLSKVYNPHSNIVLTYFYLSKCVCVQLIRFKCMISFFRLEYLTLPKRDILEIQKYVLSIPESLAGLNHTCSDSDVLISLVYFNFIAKPQMLIAVQVN